MKNNITEQIKSEQFIQDALLNESLYQVRTEDLRGALKNYSANNSFWKTVERQEIAMHQPIVHVVVNRYVSIVNSLITGFSIKDLRVEEMINDIFSKENEQTLDKLIRDITRTVLVQGDACLKIEYDPEISKEPLITIVDGIDVRYRTKKGRIIEAIFLSKYKDEVGNEYILEEYRGRGYIRYILKDSQDVIVPLETIDELKDLEDIEYEGEALFIPVKFSNHPINKHRGKPLFYDKIDMLNINDEACSKVNTVMRNSEPYILFNEKVVTKEIKENKINPMGKMIQVPTVVKKPYRGSGVLVYNDEMRGDGTFPDMVDYVNVNPYANDYETFKKMALEDVLLGVMSPETLGIESRTLDQNATAQKDREQITADNANNMVNTLREVFELLFRKTLMFKKHLMKDVQIDENVEIEINSVEYQTNNLAERAEVVQALRTFTATNISQYQATKILFPEMTEEEIQEEIKRINEETDGGLVVDDEYMITEEMLDTKYQDLQE